MAHNAKSIAGQCQRKKRIRSSFEVVKEHFQRAHFRSRAFIYDDFVELLVRVDHNDIAVHIDALDDDPIHRIHAATVRWDIDLPIESSLPVLEAMGIINDSSVISTVSAFEFDQKLSISTSLELDYPVTEDHVQYVLQLHLELARRCMEPLLNIAFHTQSVHEIADLFKRPGVADMH